MKNYQKYTLQFICFLLIVLWVYAAASKLIDFNLFKAQMKRQILFPFIKSSIVYWLPPVELLTAGLFVFQPSQRAGLYLSAIMLCVFTAYVGFALSGILGRIPCSCGGIINKMGWGTHLFFNIFFLLLTVLGIYIVNRERRTANR